MFGSSGFNRRLNIVHFRENKSDPDHRLNADSFPLVEEGQNCTVFRCWDRQEREVIHNEQRGNCKGTWQIKKHCK